MFMRRRPLLRAAVVGGGAYVAGKKAAQRSAEQAQQQDDEQNERIADPGQQQGQQAQPGGQTPSMLDQLNQLTALHEQGSLTDSEFSAAKAKLIGG
jgi:hypothetical protein